MRNVGSEEGCELPHGVDRTECCEADSDGTHTALWSRVMVGRSRWAVAMHVLTSIQVDRSQPSRHDCKILQFWDSCHFCTKHSSWASPLSQAYILLFADSHFLLRGSTRRDWARPARDLPVCWLFRPTIHRCLCKVPSSV